jgi:hypothetical protein
MVCLLIAPDRCNPAAVSRTSVRMRLRFMTNLLQFANRDLPIELVHVKAEQDCGKLLQRCELSLSQPDDC